MVNVWLTYKPSCWHRKGNTDTKYALYYSLKEVWLIGSRTWIKRKLNMCFLLEHKSGECQRIQCLNMIFFCQERTRRRICGRRRAQESWCKSNMRVQSTLLNIHDINKWSFKSSLWAHHLIITCCLMWIMHIRFLKLSYHNIITLALYLACFPISN